MRRLCYIVCTFAGVGKCKRAPGTAGSLAALPLAWLVGSYGGGMLLLAASALIYGAGILCSNVVLGKQKDADPGYIVIDEVAGQFLTLSAASLTLPSYILGFVLFRLFDIYKPFPVNWVDENLKGGLGVMTDDMLAGIYAFLVLKGCELWVLPVFFP